MTALSEETTLDAFRALRLHLTARLAQQEHHLLESKTDRWWASRRRKETAMADVAYHVERLPLYYAQAQAEYTNTTGRSLRPSAYRSGLARIRDQFYFVLAHSADVLAVFRIQEDGSLRRLQHYPHTLPKALLWRVALSRRQDRVSGTPG
jgi:hypothetical protein